MPQSHAEIRDAIENVLEDTGNAIWATTEIDAQILLDLVSISRAVPYVVKEPLKTTAASRELDFSSIPVLMGIRLLEYKADQTTQELRNFRIQQDGVLRMEYDLTIADAQDVYLYCSKLHTLPSTTTLTGQIDNGAGYSAGDTTIHIDTLGTGVIEEGTRITIAGVKYTVTEKATIASNECDVTIFPALAADVADDAAITIKKSSLSPQLEEVLIDKTASKLMLNWTAGGSAHIKTAAGQFTEIGAAIAKMSALLDQHINDLADGDDYINTVNKGFDVPMQWLRYATAQMQAAQGRLNEAKGFITEGANLVQIARARAAYRQAAQNRLDLAERKLSQLAAQNAITREGYATT